MKIAIVGAGKLGLRVTEMLMGGDHSVTVIDKDEETVGRYLSSRDVMAVVGNGKELSLLEDIGIGSYDFLIATTDRDEKNIVISALAKKLGVAKVIARIRDPEHMDQQDVIKSVFGIDYFVNPDLAVAKEINKYLVEKYTINNGVLSAGKASLLEFRVARYEKMIGASTVEAEKMIGDVCIAAVSKNGKMIIPAYGEEIELDESDYVYAVGERSVIEKFSKKVHERGKYTDIQKVMIAGGGKSGFYLAKMLGDFGASVKVIEIDKERCQYLATHLTDALILHGDATDIDLLHEENFQDMDAFVSCTGFDEENLLLALMAKQAEIEDVIAKISRDSYGELISRLGVDMALSPIDLEAGHIQQMLQGRRIIGSQVLQGQAEIILVRIEDDMAASEKEIDDLRLPDGLRIVAIERSGEIIIPDETTTLEDGDLVSVMSQLADTFDLEKLLKTRRSFLGS